MSKKSKVQRQQETAEYKKQRSKKRRDRRAAIARGEDIEVPKPRTIEDMREADNTIVPPLDTEVLGENMCDEFERFESDDTLEPKIMIITAEEYPGKRTISFLKEFTEVVPNMTYFKRKTFTVKKIVEIAISKGFTALIVLQERNGQPDSFFLSSLPAGPTSYWKLTKLKLGSEMQTGASCNSEHKPEVLMKNVSTRLGMRISRQLRSLFPQANDEAGRRVITFHNQRDFIFFRHYRYAFKDIADYTEEANERCALQEIGPSFTIKLRTLQLGTFNTKQGEYEFLWRPDSQVSRKAFAL
jgi:ribosome production factor 1